MACLWGGLCLGSLGGAGRRGGEGGCAGGGGDAVARGGVGGLGGEVLLSSPSCGGLLGAFWGIA